MRSNSRYDETSCQLCGVRFAIGRIRRPDEPESAGWDPDKDRWVEPDDKLCEAKTCGIAYRQSETDDDHPEHVAGPDCTDRRGHGGTRIGVAEMEGIGLVQCLLHKPADWKPEASDEDFEKESRFFLSGVGDGNRNDQTGFAVLPGPSHGQDAVWPGNLEVCSGMTLSVLCPQSCNGGDGSPCLCILLFHW